MELREYLAVVRKRWLSVVATTLAAVLIVGAVSLLATPQYRAATKLFFAVPGGESVSDLAQGSSFTEKQMESYAQVAVSPLVLERVIDDLGADSSPEDLAQSIQVRVPANTVILEVTASSNEAERASEIANAVGQSLTEVVASLYPKRGDGAPAVLATTLTPAVAPKAPASPAITRNLIAATLLGLAAGVALAFVRESLDTKVRSPSDVAAISDCTILGAVVFDPGTQSNPVVMLEHPGSARAEAIRRLRTNLQFVDAARASKSVLVTSSMAGEGKTTTAVNLAVALADAGERVLLIDADLRRPSVHSVLGLDNTAGLTSVLIGKVGAGEVTQPWRDGKLDILASGPIPPNPSELLGSTAMATALDGFKVNYDHIIIDSPPLIPVTDAAVLSTRVDGTIVIVGADRTHRAHLLAALEALRSVGSEVFGIVVNKMSGSQRDRYGKAYGYAHGYYSIDSKSASLSGDLDAPPPATEGPVQTRRAARRDGIVQAKRRS